MFHEVAPEYVVNLHSLEYKDPLAGIRRFLGSALMAVPFFIFGMWIANKMGSHLYPATRDTPDQAHKLPGLLRYIKSNNFDNAEDFLGRNNGNYYKSLHGEDLNASCRFLDLARKNGLNF